MLKTNKKKILKNKIFLLKNSFYFNFKIKTFLNNNSNISFLKRSNLKKKNFFSRSVKICLISGKKKSINSYIKLNRSVCNSFLRFNYLPNLKAFGQ